MLLERFVDLADLEGDVLCLPEKLLRALDALLELLERGIWQARQIAGLIDEHLRLVLEALDLVVDLLQRARGGKQVLRIVGRVIDRIRPKPNCAWAGLASMGESATGMASASAEGQAPTILG